MKRLFLKAKSIHKIYKALSSEEGKRIVKQLQEEEKNAGELKENAKTAYYLKTLLDAKVIRYRQKKTERLYSINPEVLLKFLKADSNDFAECCWLLSGRFRREILVNIDQESQVEYSPYNSKEVKKLLNAGLVTRRKEGRKAFWKTTEKLEEVLQKIEAL